MRPDRLDTSRRPFVAVWEVTQACELECKHCRADAKPERHPAELDTDEGKALLHSFADFGAGQLVVLSGGDPMVRDDTVELVEYGVDQGLRMTITPSGTSNLTPDDVQALQAAGLRRMALSIDGSDPDRHDEFRGEPGSFRQTLRVAHASRKAGLPLQINTTVCGETVDDLPAIREVVSDLGAVLWSVFFLVPVGRGRVLESITPDRAERVMEWLADVSDESTFGVKTTEAPHYRRVMMTERREASDTAGASTSNGDGIGRRTGIVAGDGFMFVSHVGEVYPSGFLPVSAGNARESDVVDLYRESDLFTRLRDRDELKGKCGACPYRGICGGSRSRAYAYTGDPLESDPLCAFVPPEYDGPLPNRQFA